MSSTTPTFTSRVWFITGTSSGLGKALTEVLLEKGDRVVATARKTEALAALQKTYPSSQLLVAKLDVTDKAQIDAAFDAALKAFGQVDIVVNNAGYAVFGEIESISEEDARKQFEVQLWGPVNVMKRAAPIFRQANKGRIFNISTIGGYMGNPIISYYSSSKFALEGFTEAYLKELSFWNVTGSIIEPGGFDSEWKGSSSVSYPVHSAYTDPKNACMVFRDMVGAKIEYIGSARRMGLALHKLAGEPQLPLRIQFGSDSHFLVSGQAMQTLADAEKYEEVSRSTDREEIDGKAWVREKLLGYSNFKEAE